jgi:hypothetical protein
MNNLQNLQAAFKRYLFEQNNSIASHIISTENFNNDQRLAIYGNAYHSRLIEALAKDFPAVYYLIGEDDFCTLCNAYIKAYPSTYYSLRWFGQNLAQFLENHKMYNRQSYLAELAYFEWTFVNAFDAKDAHVLEINDASNIPPDSWPGLQIILHPSVRLVVCSWNCLVIWQSMKNNTALPKPQLLDSKVHYLIWRHGLKTMYRSLAADEAIALSVVAKGADFSELCIALTQELETDETALRAASLFKTWLADGLIIRIDY